MSVYKQISVFLALTLTVPFTIIIADSLPRTPLLTASVQPAQVKPLPASKVNCQGWNSDYNNVENTKSGTNLWSSNITKVLPSTPQVWLDHTSATCGDTITAYIANNSDVTVQLWRIGAYRQGSGRLVRSWKVEPENRLTDNLPIGTIPAHEVKSTVDHRPAYTSASAKDWIPSFSFKVEPDWVPGTYMLIVNDVHNNLGATGTPLIVRDDIGIHKTTMLLPTLTWQAYNNWGGADLYSYAQNNGSGVDAQACQEELSESTCASEAYGDQVTFNRPYSTLTEPNAPFQSIIMSNIMAANGNLDPNWIAGQDLEQLTPVLMATKNLVVVFHDEYWTQKMRNSVTSLTNANTNFTVLSGNTMYHRSTFTDSSLTTFQTRKFHNSLHVGSPKLYGLSERYQDGRGTSNLRPQSYVTGQNFGCITHFNPLTIQDNKFWAWKKQNLSTHTTFPNLLGNEIDTPDEDVSTQKPTLNLTSCLPGYHPNPMPTSITYHVNPQSFTGTLNVGTMNWLCNLTTYTCDTERYTRSTVGGTKFVTETTTTILQTAEQGPLGKIYPQQ